MKFKKTFLHLLHVIRSGTPRAQKFFRDNQKKNWKKKWKGVRADKIYEGASKKRIQWNLVLFHENHLKFQKITKLFTKKSDFLFSRFRFHKHSNLMKKV